MHARTLPPLLALVTDQPAPLVIPPAPALRLVERKPDTLDARQVQAWVLRLARLWAGDALRLLEYKVCCVLAADYTLEYVVFGACDILKVRDYQAVARWLVRDGQQAADAVYVDGDATAMRLSWVEE